MGREDSDNSISIQAGVAVVEALAAFPPEDPCLSYALLSEERKNTT